jgi:hypothetical protein
MDTVFNRTENTDDGTQQRLLIAKGEDGKFYTTPARFGTFKRRVRGAVNVISIVQFFGSLIMAFLAMAAVGELLHKPFMDTNVWMGMSIAAASYSIVIQWWAYAIQTYGESAVLAESHDSIFKMHFTNAMVADVILMAMLIVFHTSNDETVISNWNKSRHDTTTTFTNFLVSSWYAIMAYTVVIGKERVYMFLLSVEHHINKKTVLSVSEDETL